MGPESVTHSSRLMAAFFGGLAIGAIGGLIGLGGAEFRLPLLLTVFGFVALEAVILNKAISLVVVVSALLFRGAAVPWTELLSRWPVILNLLAGSLAGAWLGADVATRLSGETLHRVIAVLLLVISVVLLFGHAPGSSGAPVFNGPLLLIVGVIAGFAIGVIASLLGVAGGEFLIPTLVLLFGIDIKLAGSLSLAISLPTMLMGLARYSRDRSFQVVGRHAAFALTMAAGSVFGAGIGALLLLEVRGSFLLPLLAALLVISAVKIWRTHPAAR